MTSFDRFPDRISLSHSAIATCRTGRELSTECSRTTSEFIDSTRRPNVHPLWNIEGIISVVTIEHGQIHENHATRRGKIVPRTAITFAWTPIGELVPPRLPQITVDLIWLPMTTVPMVFVDFPEFAEFLGENHQASLRKRRYPKSIATYSKKLRMRSREFQKCDVVHRKRSIEALYTIVLGSVSECLRVHRMGPTVSVNFPGLFWFSRIQSSSHSQLEHPDLGTYEVPTRGPVRRWTNEGPPRAHTRLNPIEWRTSCDSAICEIELIEIRQTSPSKRPPVSQSVRLFVLDSRTSITSKVGLTIIARGATSGRASTPL